MNDLGYTRTQKQRLIELDAAPGALETSYDSLEERESAFKSLQRELALENRERLQTLRNGARRPGMRVMESALIERLTGSGFVEVTTPIMMSRGMLGKMGVTDFHPLRKQIYWIDSETCLRPMLAPHLYSLMGRLGKVWPLPVRIFEVGPCFRKESKGARHLSEFTMLNLVEMGVDGDPQERLETIARELMETLGLEFRLEVEKSDVYGTTTDIVVNGVEVASGAVGPHPLDVHWDVAENWAGLGLGLERLVLLREKFNNIRRVGRSLIYLDGARLNI